MIHIMIATTITTIITPVIAPALKIPPMAEHPLIKVASIKQAARYKYGFQAGGLFKTPFEKNLFFVPSVYYSLKGYKVTLKHPSFPL